MDRVPSVELLLSCTSGGAPLPKQPRGFPFRTRAPGYRYSDLPRGFTCQITVFVETFILLSTPLIFNSSVGSFTLRTEFFALGKSLPLLEHD